MILAAGRGKRLRPLTDECPKPLIKVSGKPLLDYHIENLSQAGVEEIIINISHLGQRIQDYIASKQKIWDLVIRFSYEPEALEVGGGIFKALPMLGTEPFIIVNGDVWTDYNYSVLPTEPGGLAHLVLVNNPPHNINGDFGLRADGFVVPDPYLGKYTYSGISVLRPELFAYSQAGAFAFAPLLESAMAQNALVGEFYGGVWSDVGTYERLQTLENALALSKISRKIS